MIRREGQDDFWLNLGLVFPHKDGGGFNIMLQALPLDGKIVCRKIAEDENAATDQPVPLNERRGARRLVEVACPRQPERQLGSTISN